MAQDGAGFPGAPGGPRAVAVYAYAGARPRAATYANGTATSYTHDARGGVIEVHHTGPAGTLLRVQQLRDGARAPRARVEDAGAGLRDERFGYDSRYQLGARVAAPATGLFDLAPFLPATAVPLTAPPPRQPLLDAAIGPRVGPAAPTGADAWVHDLVGNRELTRADGVDTAYGVVDNRDRYPSVAGDSHIYDRAGNLLSDGKFTYVYDGFRRLVRIVQVATGTTVARYDHDPAGRRVVEERPGAPAVVIAYDGVDRIADYRNGACVGQYVHGPAVDDPVELAAGGAAHTYHLDLQGSVRVLSRADGTAAAMYAYDPFGVLRPSSGPLLEPPGAPSATAATQPFGYAARPFEAATASYDARARCYVPHLGRFLQRDPAGVVDGHRYTYAGNHPLAFGDPSGLARSELANSNSVYSEDHAYYESLPPLSAPDTRLYVKEGPLHKQWQAAMNYTTDSSNPTWARGVSGGLALAATPVAFVEEMTRGFVNIPFATHNLGRLIGEHAARAKLAHDHGDNVAAAAESLMALRDGTLAFLTAASPFAGMPAKGGAPMAAPLPRAVVVGGETGVLARGGRAVARSGDEVIVRRMSPAEADATVAAQGLVPKPGSRGAKWVSSGSAQKSLRRSGHEKTVTLSVTPGTTAMLESRSVDYSRVSGEAALPGGVIVKENEPGAFGIGIDLLWEFNARVTGVKVK